MTEQELARFQFEKFDIIGTIKFQARECNRALNSHRVHMSTYLTNVKKETGSKFQQSEKVMLLERNVEKIDVGIEELEVITNLETFCNIMDAERVRTRLQVKRLVQENKWLRSELFELQKRLVKLEDSVVAAEAEKQHYQYVYKMRNIQTASFDQTINVFKGADEDEEDTDPEEEVPPKIKAVHNLCMDYIREKRYEVAIPLLTQHINQSKAKTGESNNDIATLYAIMGKVYKEQGNFSEAQTNYEKCLIIREKVLGKDHNAVGITLTNLAQVQYKKKNYKEAEKNALNALRIREKVLGKNHVEYALIQSHLGLYNTALGKWNDAINHYKIAVSIYEQMYDSTDSLLMKCHLNMAKSYVKLKQNDKAADMLSIVCKSFQQKNTNRPDSNLTIFTTLNNFGEGKTKDLKAENLMKEYGAYENVMDKEVLLVLIDHFTNTGKKNVVDVIKEWSDSSDKAPTAVVRQSMSRKSIRKPSSSEARSSKAAKKNDSGLMGFFKKEKK